MAIDEGDAESSEENSVKMFSYLLDSSPDTQFFIITHKEQSKEFFSNTNNCKMFYVEKGEIKE
jgi:chromosome segregation ATPase